MIRTFKDCINPKGNIINHKLYDWKLEVFERDRGRCICCNQETNDVEVYLIDSNRVPVLDMNNGVTLCKKCRQEYIWYCDKQPSFKNLSQFLKLKNKLSLRKAIIKYH